MRYGNCIGIGLISESKLLLKHIIHCNLNIKLKFTNSYFIYTLYVTLNLPAIKLWQN